MVIEAPDTVLIIDPQNDFCPGGALAVADGDAIMEPINALAQGFGRVVITQDWHPQGHDSFASTHGAPVFSTTELAYGTQVLWPDHCVQGTRGAEFHRNLDVGAHAIIRKGFRKAIDSYSAFMENDHQTPTGLAGYLRECGAKHLLLCGLATDYCVAWSAMDAVRHGFGVSVALDCCRAIDLDGSLDKALEDMRAHGCILTEASAIQPG